MGEYTPDPDAVQQWLRDIAAGLTALAAGTPDGSGVPGGSSAAIQFNDAGDFGGFGTYNSGTDEVALPGGLALTGGFGANGKGAQTAYVSGGAVVTTTPALASYGYTQAQAAAIITLLNNIRAALVANGIMS